jgi:sugar phosphate isomerase/epimerase
MSPSVNLCTAILPACSFGDVVEIACAAGYQGIELRVDAQYHKSLEALLRDGVRIKRVLETRSLQLPILTSYIPLDDHESISKLLLCCKNMSVPRARVVLPRSCQAAVVRQAQATAIIPSYDVGLEPRALLGRVRRTLWHLEREAATAGVQLLLELHWGTIMSSFSSAYFFTHDLDPECIAITFDPANMLVEGKEDWEFGLKLIQPHLANVHVKNMCWSASPAGWVWAWAPLMEGMVDWPDLLALLRRNHYHGAYAIEDFLAPSSKSLALTYLSRVRSEFCQLYEHASAADAKTWFSEPHTVHVWGQSEQVTRSRKLSEVWQ